MATRIGRFFTHKTVLAIEAVFAAFAPLFFYACRSSSHVFLDTALFSGFSQLLFWLMAANAIAVTTEAALKWRKTSFADEVPKPMTAICGVSFAATAIFAVTDIVMLIVMGGESAPVAFRSISEMLPYAFGYVAVAFFAIFFPVVKGKTARRVTAAVTIAIGIFGAVFALYPPTAYEFLSDPMVIDTGSGYSVVFATSDTGTGYVEYEYDEESYRVYDQNNGRILGSSTIHSINVPYEHLDNNSYSVGSTRVYEEYAYGGRNGRTIESEEYLFTPCRGETQTYLCISDWHTHTDAAKDAIAHTGEFDAVLMMGDAVPGLQYEEEAAVYIVQFGGDISGGTKPIIYTRGNHETRGAYASELADALGLDRFYGTVQAGDYRFVVLDSAEDKTDDHPEYGGLADYGAYRKEITEWVETLTEGGRTVVLCHAPEIFIEQDLTDRTVTALRGIGATMMISGHLHTCYLDENGPVYVDGGFNGGKYIASRVTLSPDGIGLYACDNHGETVLEEHIDWIA